MYQPPRFIYINFVIVIVMLWILWIAVFQAYDSKGNTVCIALG